MSYGAELLSEFWNDLIRWGLEKVANRYYSFYMGIVVDNVDPENLDRLQVAVPMISDEPLGDWAHPKYHYAAANAGGRFIPDKGDRVWIEFEHGDLRFPYWTAGVWDNPEDGEIDTPVEFIGNQHVRGYISKKGHGLYWDDGDGSERVIMQWSDGSGSKFSVVSIDKDGNIQIRDHAGNMITTKAGTGVTIWDQHGNLYTTDSDGARIVAQDGSFVDLSKNLMQLVSKKDMVVVGNAVSLKAGGVAIGDGASEPMVLGNQLMLYLQQLVNLLISHVHPIVAPTPGTPTGPSTVPFTPPTPSILSKTNTVK